MKRNETKNILIPLILLVFLLQNDTFCNKMTPSFSLLLIRGSLVRAQEREQVRESLYRNVEAFLILGCSENKTSRSFTKKRKICPLTTLTAYFEKKGNILGNIYFFKR